MVKFVRVFATILYLLFYYVNDEKVLGDEENLVGHIPIKEIMGILVGEINLGTPAQLFHLEVDLWSSSTLTVISPKANLSDVPWFALPKSVFHSDKSTTYEDLAEDFNDITSGKGGIARDTLTLGKFSVPKFTFGMINEIAASIKINPIDGVIGLASKISSTGPPALIDQISDALNVKMFTFWANRTQLGNGNGHLTFGAEDSTHCESDWAYASHMKNTYMGKYAVHVTSVVATWMGKDGKKLEQREELDGLLSIRDSNALPMSIPEKLLPLLAKANEAGFVYNEDFDRWEVDCDAVEKMSGEMTLNIGGSGKDDTDTHKLKLSKFDFLNYDVSCFFNDMGYICNFYAEFDC
ncbi:eukaryotic aspartyl protease domain-containing protein [Ditylenchus destructor]|nr:eukaryotic aspartyl protease domain-containing protein [Ditylenchus destructor]